MCSHSVIQLINIGFSLSHKICFEDFSAQVPYGSRIALIGPNGSGKSTLLKILLGSFTASSGNLIIPQDVIFGYVPQIIQDFDNVSGGERFNKALSKALSIQPNILLLDEPTNHLDKYQRKSFLKMLQHFPGTVIFASHDVELLKSNVKILWHIHNEKIHIFSGDYENYMESLTQNKLSIEKEIKLLKQNKREMHDKLMKEQNRASQSRKKGERNIDRSKWPTVVSKTKAGRSNQTSDKIKAKLEVKKQYLIAQLAEKSQQEEIKPIFNLNQYSDKTRTLVCLHEASVGYKPDEMLIEKINLSLHSSQKIALSGNNGSGKSTLVKAILGRATSKLIQAGSWHCPKTEEIGYLDQHYENLFPNETIFDLLKTNAPTLGDRQLREHLARFLFRKNKEIDLKIKYLSGGERVRLSLALIAIKQPKLLILDEITNNVDMITREHIIQVLKCYPGAMIVISHDEDFLRKIEISDRYLIENGELKQE